MFEDAYREIRHVLEANLLQRFSATQEFKDEEKKEAGTLPHRERNRSSDSFGGGGISGGNGGRGRVDDGVLSSSSAEAEDPQVVVADY